jgi:hypothetical protein
MGLSLNDHLNPPPAYDIALQNLSRSGTRIESPGVLSLAGSSKRGTPRASVVSLESLNRLTIGGPPPPPVSQDAVVHVVSTAPNSRKTSVRSMPFNAVIIPKV